MIKSIPTQPASPAPERAFRGYQTVYREREKNFCPGCGRTHWWIGRMSAECASCGAIIPFAEVRISGGMRHVSGQAGTTSAID